MRIGQIIIDVGQFGYKHEKYNFGEVKDREDIDFDDPEPYDILNYYCSSHEFNVIIED